MSLRQFAKFLIVGAINTVFGLTCIMAAIRLFGADYRVANAIGYAAGCCLAFALNRSWTFRFRGGWQASLARWLLIIPIAYAANLGTVILLHGALPGRVMLPQLGGMAVYTVLTFLASRFFVFREPSIPIRAEMA